MTYVARITTRITCALALICLASGPSTVRAATPLTATPVVSGLTQPLFLTYAPGDTTRLFVIERAGLIRIIKNGVLQPTPFMNCSTLVRRTGGEQGLLGLAFHPDYASNRYFYINYTRSTDGATVVSRFQRSSTSQDSGLVSTQDTLLIVPQPFSNHNGGMMAFGPDGYLYIGLGDGGSGGDPGNRAQDSTTLLGKILRIDVDAAPLDYSVPPDNPFVGQPGWQDEIWAIGVRNPWRFSFDRVTGDMYMGDVGQGNWEEVNYEPASSSGGLNYGWRLKEGDHCYSPSTGCESLTGLTDPFTEYSHTEGCSVTGGYVYRGCAIPDLTGTYFYGDYCQGTIWSLNYDGSTVTSFQDRSTELELGSIQISSFGEDWNGELYIVHYGGTIYKIVPDGVPSACNVGPCCVGTTGNVNVVGSIDLSDLSLLIAYLTTTPRPVLPCPDEANINALGSIDLTDLSLLISYLVSGSGTFPNCP